MLDVLNCLPNSEKPIILGVLVVAIALLVVGLVIKKVKKMIFILIALTLLGADFGVAKVSALSNMQGLTDKGYKVINNCTEDLGIFNTKISVDTEKKEVTLSPR